MQGEMQEMIGSPAWTLDGFRRKPDCSEVL